MCVIFPTNNNRTRDLCDATTTPDIQISILVYNILHKKILFTVPALRKLNILAKCCRWNWVLWNTGVNKLIHIYCCKNQEPRVNLQFLCQNNTNTGQTILQILCWLSPIWISVSGRERPLNDGSTATMSGFSNILVSFLEYRYLWRQILILQELINIFISQFSFLSYCNLQYVLYIEQRDYIT